MARVDRAERLKRNARVFAAFLTTAVAGLATSGCRVNEDDLHRWESTDHGPRKLCAVLVHDKYDTPLRVEAAIALIRMKPRAGRRVAFTAIDPKGDLDPCKGTLVEAMSAITPEVRQTIIASLVPAIINELKKPPPAAQANQAAPPDGSYPFKDAAYAMLTLDRTVIVADEGLKQSLKGALVDWAMADFQHRLDNRGQAYGMEQLLRFIGAPAVAGIPKLMTRDAKLDSMAGLVAELGDPKTKEAASSALVAVVTFVISDEWRKIKEPELKAANAASRLEPTEKQFEAQLAQYRDEDLFRVFGAMRKVGGRPSIDFLLNFASKKEESEKRRQAALAALEGRLDRNNPDDLKRILQIASTDAPDVVLDQAFRRIGEMPREAVIEKLYEIWKTDKWKVRRAAAGTILKMSTVKNIDEFMGKLPEGAAAKGFAMPEPFAYGASLGDLKDGKPLDALRKYFSSGSAAARTSALAYWYTFGTAADLPTIQAFEGDKTSVPVCDTDPDCKWACEVAKEGAKDPKDPKEREMRDVKTVGDFVRYCVEPAMRERQPEAKKDEKK
jgi:HEAT repeat protein